MTETLVLPRHKLTGSVLNLDMLSLSLIFFNEFQYGFNSCLRDAPEESEALNFIETAADWGYETR
ncbi:MAG: hypothetical protein KDJ22_01360 [Candidatus Competibacteraceae bacterium]|nr:hypothetical protein [Candidatus Competibacteraceae bacterium]MCP5125346.1 hypothetical protein [Gammaproteobacteria bacterium]HRX70251.1 hypothetical protein [Candidatus Competibacteraceae bacterium]